MTMAQGSSQWNRTDINKIPENLLSKLKATTSDVQKVINLYNSC